MDILSAKQKVFTDAPPEAAKERSVTLGNFSIKFGDLLSRAGVGVDKAANALASFSEIRKVTERVEPPAPAEKQNYEQDYERNDDAPRAERYENSDSSREQYVERKDAPDSGGDDLSNTNDDAPDDAKADNEPAADDDAPSGETQDDDAPSGDNKKTDNETAEQEQSSSSEASKQNTDSDAKSDVAEKGEGHSGAQHSEEVLSSLLVAAASSASVNQVAEQASSNGAENAQGKNAAEGLAKALAAVGGEKTSKGETSAPGAQNQKPLAQIHEQSQKQQAPQEQIQSQNQAKGSPAAAAVSQQAAGIAKLAGEGARININVNTSEGAASVVSKPSSTLSAASILSADGPAQQQKGPQPMPNLGAANPNAAAAQGPPAQNQAQQASAQIATAAGGQAKAPVQGVPTATAGVLQTQTASVDGAINSGPNASPDTSQTLKNAAAQTNNAQNANLPKQAVLNQVTVQINKAIKAGLDRISIQLRPENLGRVDVRLEIGQDGRTQAVVIADSKDTLDLLQRDAKELTRALQDAGLDLANEDLNFGLREQNAEGDGKEGSSGSSSMDDMEEAEEDISGNALADAYDGGIIEDGRIDIRA